MQIIAKKRSSVALSDGSEELIMAVSFIADDQDEADLLTHFHRIVTKGGRIDFVEPIDVTDDGNILEQTISILVTTPPSPEDTESYGGAIILP